MNILFTCIGRRVELIQCFRNAAKKLKMKLNVFGTDMDKTAPAIKFCDRCFITPNIANKNYISTLIKICKNYKIDALIPTIDTDLYLLSKHLEEFKRIKTKVIISDEKTIKICRNKISTSTFFRTISINTPKVIKCASNYDGKFPIFIKPVAGSSSIDAYKINDKKELTVYSSKINNSIISQFIKGVEITIDVLSDFNAKPLLITPRIRLATRSGEVSKTQIINDEKIVEEVKKIMENLKLIGPSTIQLIRNEVDNKDYFIEINPRFGGGAPLSIKAGADSPLLLLKLLNGNKLKYTNSPAISNSVWSRYDQSVRVK